MRGRVAPPPPPGLFLSTLYRLAFDADMKNYPVRYEQQCNRTGTKAFTHIEHRARVVGHDVGVALNPNHHFWIQPTLLLRSLLVSYDFP